jgi:hypothetical protein
MLIKCPKCGFSQPKDHYCAHCGVNIDKFTPEKENITKAFFSHLLVQISLVTLVAGVTITYFFTRQDLAQKNAPTYRKKIYSSFSKNTASVETSEVSLDAKSDTSHAGTILVEPKNAQEADALISPPSMSTSNATPTNNIDSQNSSTSNNQSNISYHIPLYLSFHEIDGSLLNDWIKENSELGEREDDNSEVKSGIISMTQFRQQVRDKSLLTENKKMTLKKKENFLFGLNKEDPNLFSGFQIELQIDTVKTNQISAQLVIRKLIATTSSPSTFSKKINLKIDIKKDHMFYVFWKDDLNGFEDNLEIQKVPPFHIFKSNRYISRKSDFVFIVYSDFIFNQSSTMNTKNKNVKLASTRSLF